MILKTLPSQNIVKWSYFLKAPNGCISECLSNTSKTSRTLDKPNSLTKSDLNTDLDVGPWPCHRISTKLAAILVTLVYQYVLGMLAIWKWSRGGNDCLTGNHAGCLWPERYTMTHFKEKKEHGVLGGSENGWQHFTLCSAAKIFQQTVYSVLYIKYVFSSFSLCIFSCSILVCKSEQTFARRCSKNVNRCTHTHPFTLLVCCFYLVALQCHTEYGENIFLEANKSRQSALFRR